MPNVQTEELAAIIEAGRYERLVVRCLNERWFLLAIDPSGETLIHANQDGRHKEYRHSWQATDWVRQRFGMVDVAVEEPPARPVEGAV